MLKIKVIVLFLLVGQFASAQLSIEPAKPNLFNFLEDGNEPMSDGPYRVYLELMDTAPRKSEVLITDLKELSIIAIPRTIPTKYSDKYNEDFEAKEYTARNIKSICIKTKNKGRNYSLIGAAIGGGLGFAISALSKDSASDVLGKGFSNILVASSFAVAGGVVGYVIGSAKLTIPINGSNHNYKLKKEQLHKYVILQE